jgi:pyruvate dehydrogenase E2 component (dihydrolipoamide acetyltransferase)
VAEQEIRIPDIGDAKDVEVVEVLVAVGDRVEADGPLIVIESDKASMEIPAPVAGEIKRVEVNVGDSVTEGQVVAVMEVANGGAAEKPNDKAEPKEPAKAQKATKTPPAEPGPAKSPEKTAAREAAPPKSADKQRLEVRVPDIGDAKDVSVVEVAVKVGAEVKVDDLLAVLESDKASMEVPAPAAGKVLEVAIHEGDAVNEGSLLVVLEAAGAAPEKAPDQVPKETPAPQPRAESAAPPAPAAKPAATKRPAPAPTRDRTEAERPREKVYAGPAVRRLARELGVTLSQVKGSGPRGRIVKEDVQAFVKEALTSSRTESMGAGIPAVPELDYAKFGEVEKVELTRVRARGAVNLHRSWLNVVHVTQHDEADVTDLEDFRVSLKPEAEAREVKLTPLPFIMKACVHALKAFPTFNASLDKDLKHLWHKRYYNIGIAVDTDVGLLVPVVRDVDRKGVLDLAAEIAELSDRARAHKSTVDDLQGATFTISSLGPIGGTGFTPIVNAPEVAILGVSRLAVKPVWNGKEFAPRKMLPLSLSYDHRAINGAEAGRFVSFLSAVLGDLRRTLL